MEKQIQSRSICGPVLIFCIAIFVLLSSPLAKAERIEVSLGGKGIFGPYFLTAGTIATLVNQKRDDHGINITVKSRRDSASILTSVLSGEFECGVVQMSWISKAVKGQAEWKGSPQSALRSVFNVQAEPIGLVATVQSGIRRFGDLKARRVFIGSPSSDLHNNVVDLLNAAGIDPQSDITVLTNTAFEEVPDLVQDNTIDAFFYVIGTTSRTFIDLVSKPQKVLLIPITGPGVENMIATHPFVKKTIVSIASYPYFANTSDVETVGFKAGLITTDRVSDKTIFTISKVVVEDFEYSKNRHPTSVAMMQDEMTHNMIAPVHSGAKKYFKISGIGYSTITQ